MIDRSISSEERARKTEREMNGAFSLASWQMNQEYGGSKLPRKAGTNDAIGGLEDTMTIMAKVIKLTSARAAKAAFFASLMSAVPASAKTERDLVQFSKQACGIGKTIAQQSIDRERT